MAPARKAKRATKTRTAGKKTARKGAAKRGGGGAAKRAAPAATSRPKNVTVSPRKSSVFSTTDLYDHVGKWNPNLGKKEVRTVVDDTLNTVHAAIKKVGKVRLKGIGTITTRKKPAQKGGKLVRNPFTGEMVKSKPKPASVRVKLSAAKELKQP